MANLAPASIHICRLRATRLNDDGTLAGTTDNSYVTDKINHLNYSPQFTDGEVREVVNGCGATCLLLREPDRFTGLNLEIEQCRLEPALLEMMTGMSAVLDDGTPPNIIGLNWPTADFAPVAVAIEAWTDAWNGDQFAPAGSRFIRWVFPRTKWRMADGNLENDFNLPTLNGFSEANGAWGDGPYGVGDAGAQIVDDNGGWYWDPGPLPSVSSPEYADLATAA